MVVSPCYRRDMTENSPPDTKTTTVRLPADLHHRVAASMKDARRSFNNEVIVLLEYALDAKDREQAGQR